MSSPETSGHDERDFVMPDETSKLSPAKGLERFVMSDDEIEEMYRTKDRLASPAKGFERKVMSDTEVEELYRDQLEKDRPEQTAQTEAPDIDLGRLRVLFEGKVPPGLAERLMKLDPDSVSEGLDRLSRSLLDKTAGQQDQIRQDWLAELPALEEPGVAATPSMETAPDQKYPGFHYTPVEKTEAEKMLDTIVIDGEPFEGKQLTVEMLRDEGLEPRHRVEIGEAVVWLSSSPYEVHDSRMAVVGYVEHEGKRLARTFYRSSSQGAWRLLPDYVSESGSVEWYGKGWGEDSLTLPYRLQETLAEISNNSQSILKPKNPELVFAGTTVPHGRQSEYEQQIESTPIHLDGNFYSQRGQKVPPEELVFNDTAQEPDFHKPLAGWEQQSELYGPMDVEVFPSKDGSLAFTFCRDREGRAWISGIENSSEITSIGLHKRWIKGGDLTTPAFEYSDQTEGYGNRLKTKGPYDDMFDRYLSKVPIIQEYVKLRSSSPLRETAQEEAPTTLKPAAVERNRPEGQHHDLARARLLLGETMPDNLDQQFQDLTAVESDQLLDQLEFSLLGKNPALQARTRAEWLASLPDRIERIPRGLAP